MVMKVFIEGIRTGPLCTTLYIIRYGHYPNITFILDAQKSGAVNYSRPPNQFNRAAGRVFCLISDPVAEVVVIVV